MSKLILDLCAGSGAWSEPYRKNGYVVIQVDPCLDRDPAMRDVRLMPHIGWRTIHGILAAPPCTVFASSGARWHRSKADLLAGLSVVDACLRIVALAGPVWWALENPVGTLRRYLGPPTLRFDPCDYGDPYTKRTLLWGNFNLPKPAGVIPERVNRIHHMSPGPDRGAKRSITPPAFAQAFMEANP